MPLRKTVRESAFNLARRDLATFLEEHEDRLLAIFREEMQMLDDSLPEEQVFIDLNLPGIGEAILRAVLQSIRRFLLEVSDRPAAPVARPTTHSSAAVQPVENVPFWRRKSR